MSSGGFATRAQSAGAKNANQAGTSKRENDIKQRYLQKSDHVGLARSHSNVNTRLAI